MKRTAETLGLYGALGCLGYILGGLGAIVPELRDERALPRAEAALYPSGFALGLLVVGLCGHRVTPKLGRFAIPISLAALAGGAVILAAGRGRFDTGVGAIVLGLGGAGLVQLVAPRLRSLHRQHGAVVLGESNAVSSVGSVLAPLIVGAVLAWGPGWRFGFLALPVLVTIGLLVVLLRPRAADVATTHHEEPSDGRAPREFLGWWLTLVLAVAAEFCMLFWSADFLRTEKSLSSGLATGAAAAFLLGMAIGRAAIGAATKRLGDGRRLMISTVTLALVGFATFWAVPITVISVAGLFVTGLGISVLYPVVLAHALAAWPSHPTRAAARCALASGIAIGAGPLLLGLLADLGGMRYAFLFAAVVLVILLVESSRTRTAVLRTEKTPVGTT